MLIVMRAFLLIPVAAALFAQNPPDPSERLARAREILIQRDARLPDYTCVQTVERRYFKRRHAAYPPPDCDQIRSLRPDTLVLESTDRLRLELKVSQGHEIGSWAGSGFTSRDIFDLIGGGPYGTGMIGALIDDIFVNGGAAYGYMGENSNTGRSLSIYTYRVPVESSHYRVKADSNWVLTAFYGVFWLDSNSLDLKRLIVDAHDLPPETRTCEAATGVDYQKVKVGAGEFLLPQRSTMHLVMADESETQSTAVYSGCREYRGEAVIHFDEVPMGGETKTAEASATPLPAGLPFSLALTEPIDTDTAAAGDIVRAKVRAAVRDARSKAVLAPAGAMVQGRIVQMQHWLDRSRQFRISILLEKLETGGVSRPLYAKIDHGHATTITLPPVGQSPLVGVFPFTTDKDSYRVPAGYQSNWVTVAPPPAR